MILSRISSRRRCGRPGSDLTLVTYGWTLQLSLQAAEKIHAETGAEIEVVDLRVLNPLDKDTFPGVAGEDGAHADCA